MTAKRVHRERVARLEVLARRAPRAYLARLALLAGLGYGLLLALPAVGFGLPLLMLGHILVNGARPGPELAYAFVLPLVFGAVALRALWIRFDIPQGYVLAQGEAPGLEAEVERLRRTAGAPPLQGIVIDGELNAAAASVPRALGLLGHRHYLVLGLPLMQLLDRDELAAVIAHEFGHFGAEHGRFAGWIYRVRMSWHRVLEGLSNGGSAFGLLLLKFYAWYVPYFNAYSFVLARSHEYQADAAAAEAVGAETAAGALVRLELGARRLQARFWPELRARARAQSHPPAQVQAPLRRMLQEETVVDLDRLLQIARREADPDDTHPALPQRIAALGVAPGLRPRGEPAAALVPSVLLAEIERGLDGHWRDSVRAQWRECHDSAAAERARLAALEGLAQPSPQERLEHACLVESLRPDFDAGPLYERALAALPDSSMAHYRAGLAALRRGAVALGVDRLQRAVALDAGAVKPLLEALEALERDPQTDAATAAAVAALRDEHAPQARSLEAREGAGDGDELLPHDLDAAVLGELSSLLAGDSRVAAAWLARKRMAMTEEPPHYVILLDWRGSVASETAGLKRIVDALSLPGSCTVFTGAGRRALARRVRQACSEPVYRKGR